jgi:hypothetical protein
MSGRPDAAPIFVVGAPRSGSRLLAWSLAEHPALGIVPGGPWLAMVAAALGPAFRSASRGSGGGEPEPTPEELDRFLLPFRSAVWTLLERGPRWEGRGSGGAGEGGLRGVDPNPENLFHLYGISRLFPRARVIHVVRPLEAVVEHLTASPTSDPAYHTRASAIEEWLRHVRAGLEVESALGPEVVLRVRHTDLVDSPVAELKRCLEFLGEPFHHHCLRPLRGIRPDPVQPSGQYREGDGWRAGVGRESPSWREARELDRSLDGGLAEVPGASERLGRRFLSGESALTGDADPGTPLARLRQWLQAAVPEGRTVLVVSRGDEGLTRIPGRQGWHFPQVEGGVYAGHHPADSDEAIGHLEELRERGADFLAIPCTSYWWMDHYTDFRRHLETRYRLVAFHEDLCLLFVLSPAGGEAVAGIDHLPNQIQIRSEMEVGG